MPGMFIVRTFKQDTHQFASCTDVVDLAHNSSTALGRIPTAISVLLTVAATTIC